MKLANLHPSTAFTLVIGLLALGWCSVVFASDSDSFSNTDAGLSNGANFEAGSDNFQMDGSVTWRAEGESDSFQMTFESPGITEESGDSDDTSDADGTSEDSLSGGHRGTGTQSSSGPAAEATSSLSFSPSLPTLSTQPSFKAPRAAVTPSVRPAPFVPPSHPAAPVASTFYPVPEDSIRPAPTAITVPQPLDEAVHDETSSALHPCMTLPTTSHPLDLFLFSAGVPFIVFGYTRRAKSRTVAGRRRHRIESRMLCIVGVLLTLAGFLSSTGHLIQRVHAEATMPLFRIYNGQLRNASGVAIKTPHMIRFSYWRSTDALASDRTATGSLNINAPNFLGWQEVHTFTPNNNGNFTVKLGSVTSLADFETLSASEAQNLHLQVEVKPAGAQNAAYEILDINPANTAVDRSPVLPVPFARNADLLDLRDVGTGSGDITFLGSGGLLGKAAIPGGTNADSFTINSDDTSVNPTLQFGQSLAKTLIYDVANSRFSFNTNVHIVGNLTLTGLVNGVDIAALGASSGSGETVKAVLHPTYPSAAYTGDGSNNIGQLSVTNSGSTYYIWTSTRSTLQDYDIVIRYTLPLTFDGWTATPVSFDYRTTDALPTLNALSFSMFDTAGQPVTLLGGAVDLTSILGATKNLTFQGTPAWTAGQDIVLRFKLSSKSGNLTQLGKLQLHYRKLN